jgi:hypothetical protein
MSRLGAGGNTFGAPGGGLIISANLAPGNAASIKGDAVTPCRAVRRPVQSGRAPILVKLSEPSHVLTAIGQSIEDADHRSASPLAG